MKTNKIFLFIFYFLIFSCFESSYNKVFAARRCDGNIYNRGGKMDNKQGFCCKGRTNGCVAGCGECCKMGRNFKSNNCPCNRAGGMGRNFVENNGCCPRVRCANTICPKASFQDFVSKNEANNELKSSDFKDGFDKNLVDNNLTKENLDVDVIVVGAGPAGITASAHAARAGFKTLVFGGEQDSGQLVQTTYVENFPACPKILGSELIKKLKDQAISFGAKFKQLSVEKVDFSEYPYAIYSKDGSKFKCKAFIVASGVVTSWLGIKGEQEYLSKGVYNYALSEAQKCSGKNVVVIGGGNSAMEYASILARYANTVKIFVRSSKVRAIESMQNDIKKFSNIEIIFNTSIAEIIGNGDCVTSILIENNLDGSKKTIETDAVFVAIGGEPNTDFLKGALDLDERGYIKITNKCQGASIDGVFAAGDVVGNHFSMAAIAVGDGLQAGMEAAAFLSDSIDLSNSASSVNTENKETQKDYIVCFCKGIYYSQIVEAINNGANTFEDLKAKLGACTGCRGCEDKIRQILKNTLQK